MSNKGQSTTRILSVVEDAAGNFVLLNLSRRVALPAPTIRFFPAGNGEAMLVADFSATVLDTAPAFFSMGKTIKSVRVGQLSANPPVVRLSIVARDRSDLSKIDFRTAAGSLIVKLPEADLPFAPSYARADAPPVAPPFKRATPPTLSAVEPHVVTRDVLKAELRGPISLNDVYLPPTSAEAIAQRKTRSKHSKPSGPFAARDFNSVGDDLPLYGPPRSEVKEIYGPPNLYGPPASAKSVDAAKLADAAKQAIDPTAQQLSIDVNSKEPFNIRIRCNRAVSFDSFTLADPARFVVDITGLAPEEIAETKELTANPFVRAIRIGQPDDKENVTRVVLDLNQSDCTIKESIASEKNALIIGFGTGAPVSVANTTVVLDAGHGGTDPGAQRGDIQEKELTLGITAKLKKHLESRGIRVVMTRADDSFVSLEDRVKITNSTSPDAFVSVHINSLESNNAITGIETYFQNDRSRSLANLIHSSLVKELAVPDRNVRKARFYVINHTPLPAVLAEVGFISNKEERDKLVSSDYQQQVAQALANGVILYLSNRAATGTGGTNSALPPSNSPKGFTQILQSQSSKAPNEAVTQLKSQKKQVAAKRS